MVIQPKPIIKIEEPVNEHPRHGKGFVLRGLAIDMSIHYGVQIEGYYALTGQLVVYESLANGVMEHWWNNIHTKELIGLHEPGIKIEDVLPEYKQELEKVLKEYVKR